MQKKAGFTWKKNGLIQDFKYRLNEHSKGINFSILSGDIISQFERPNGGCLLLYFSVFLCPTKIGESTPLLIKNKCNHTSKIILFTPTICVLLKVPWFFQLGESHKFVFPKSLWVHLCMLKNQGTPNHAKLLHFSDEYQRKQVGKTFPRILGITFPHEQLQCNISWKGLPYRHHSDAKLVDEYPPPDHGGKGVVDSQKKWYFIILQKSLLTNILQTCWGVGWEKNKFKTNHDGLWEFSPLHCNHFPPVKVKVAWWSGKIMRNWFYLPVAYGRISPTKFYRGLARIKGTSSFPASGIKACQSTFFQGFLLHPFKLWIWKGKLKTPILDEHQKNVHKLAETSRTFFTQFFFLERFLQLFFTVPL